MTDKAIDWLPPENDPPSTDPLAPPDVLKAIDPVLADYRDKVVIKRLLNKRVSISELENWMYDFNLSDEDERKGHMIRFFLDWLDGRGLLDKFVETLRRDREDLFD